MIVPRVLNNKQITKECIQLSLQMNQMICIKQVFYYLFVLVILLNEALGNQIAKKFRSYYRTISTKQLDHIKQLANQYNIHQLKHSNSFSDSRYMTSMSIIVNKSLLYNLTYSDQKNHRSYVSIKAINDTVFVIESNQGPRKIIRQGSVQSKKVVNLSK